MDKKVYYKTVSTIFLIIGILHLLRIFQGWEAVIGGVVIPLWASWAAVIIAGYLSYRGFSLSK